MSHTMVEIPAERMTIPLPPGYRLFEDSELLYALSDDAPWGAVGVFSKGLSAEALTRCIAALAARRKTPPEDDL